MQYRTHTKIQGFTLIELLVTIAIFGFVVVGITSVFKKIIEISRMARIKTVATTVANEFIEFTRLLPYEDVGLVSGIPTGVLPQDQIVVREEYTFLLQTYVRNLDDEFDGLVTDTNPDQSPADYKLVETTITCQEGCELVHPLVFTTRVAPKGLESQGTNGSIIVQVLHADGTPVSDATVTIINQALDPEINFYDTTDDTGILAIVDAPPADQSYELYISKEGYTGAQTYPASDLSGLGYGAATTPHVTVQQEQVTQLTFFIDTYSTATVETVDTTCAAVGSVDYSLTGSRLIGTNPDVFLYDISDTTNMSGSDTRTDVPWDTYTLGIPDASYELIGTNRYNNVTISPGAMEVIQAIVKPRTPRTLVVAALDATTGLPLDGVSATLSRSGYSETKYTGLGSITQVDWSGGSGQEMYTNQTKYLTKTSGVEVNSQGDIQLTRGSNNRYQLSGNLESSTFLFPEGVNFYTISWTPTSQPSQTGSNSLRFQVASNTDNLTWNYIGPDGTSSSYYTVTNNNLHASHDNDTHLRYKAYLSTGNNRYTPTVSAVSFVYDSDCAGPGYTYFTGLTSSQTYTLSVSKSGYSTNNTNVTMSENWKSVTVSLQPS